MVLVTVSKTGWAFLCWTWGKSQWHWQVLPGCSSIAANVICCYVVGDNLVFQQDSAPAHQAHDTIELLQRETPDFISPELWPPTVWIWTPLITRFGQSYSSVCTRCRSTMSTNSSSDWLIFGAVGSKFCQHCCQWMKKASVDVCSREGRTLRTSAVGCFTNRMELSIDSLCTMCFESF